MHLAAVAGGSSRNDAVAGAASTVLLHLYPDEAARIDALSRALAKTDGYAFALGRLVGEVLVARAKTDGSDAAWTATPLVGPGFWVPTPPGFLLPLESLAGSWRTWNLDSSRQFRPPPPPAYGSPLFDSEAREVYRVSRSLTREQQRIATYWSDGAGTVTPPGHWNVIALDLLRSANWDTLRSTYLLAALNTAQRADGDLHVALPPIETGATLACRAAEVSAVPPRLCCCAADVAWSVRRREQAGSETVRSLPTT